MKIDYKLIIEEYCKDCPNFKTDILEEEDWFCNDEIILKTITIMCEYRKTCKYLVKKLKENS